jgi:hypothetical protein
LPTIPSKIDLQEGTFEGLYNYPNLYLIKTGVQSMLSSQNTDEVDPEILMSCVQINFERAVLRK